MQSRWEDGGARDCIARHPEAGELLATRVYSSRLIGADADLVLHGGGNTSLKTTAVDLFGESIDVLHVKASGHDLASIEPGGLPALRLLELVRLRSLDDLDDESLVSELRRALLDSRAPTPSVETLLHAFLPHRFIDHSHADAILALTSQPDGEARVRALFGERVGWVPYAMPGLRLAKRAAEVHEKNRDVEGLIVERHGLFSFGDDARTSYDRHIALVDEAERHILERVEGRRILDARPVVAMRDVAEVAPLVRGAVAEATGDPDRPFRRFVLEHRTSDQIQHFAASELGAALAAQAPISLDHVIRTKGPYLLVERPPFGDLEALASTLRAEVERYRLEYLQYFDRWNGRDDVPREAIDPTPRVVVLPGLGLFAAGETRRDARVAADIAEHTIKTKIWAATIGMYAGATEDEIFEMEYWSLQRAKLARGRDAPALQGQVAVVTGGGGAIGEGVARQLLEAGACVLLLDIDEARLDAVHTRLGSPDCERMAADITDEDALRDSFEFAAETFGGVDIVVPNAGIAMAGAIDTLELDDFERAVDVNLKGAFLTLREALRGLKRQGTGGSIVMISTKNVPMPGAEFGAYSASKAGGHQLGRIAAAEAAPFGIRVNMINADAIFGTRENPSGLWQEVGPARAAARGLDPSELGEFYRKRNLLEIGVTADHVGRAVVFFASQLTPTTGAALPVDGGLPDATPR